jgi:hypothetical protein
MWNLINVKCQEPALFRASFSSESQTTIPTIVLHCFALAKAENLVQWPGCGKRSFYSLGPPVLIKILGNVFVKQAMFLPCLIKHHIS